MFIKICGLTRVEDALAAVDNGANAIGYILARSQRQISLELLESISSHVPASVKQVGVFVNPERQKVEEVLERVNLDFLQFHGQETGAYCRSFGCDYIKAIAVSDAFSIAEVAAEHPTAHAFLLDTYDKQMAGGSGRSFNWSHWPAQSDKPLILAGGLTPDNVAGAIAKVSPYGVDVSGGVEAANGGQKGIKDPELIRRFIQQVRSCS